MRALFILIALLLAATVGAAPLEIRLPLTGAGQSRDTYQRALLHLLLDEAGVDYRITIVPVRFSQARIIHELTRGELINLYWMGTSPELERRLLPVRYPLYRGLLGYRLLFIRDDRQTDFDSVRSAEDLGKFTGGQGIGWSDVAVLNGRD